MNFAKRKKNKARLLLQGCTTEIILKISDCVIDGDDDDLIVIFSSWAIQIYKLVIQENKNSILDIII